MNEVTTRPPAPALPLQVDNSEAAKLTRAIIAAAKNPEIQMDKMERLLDLHERITAKEAEQQFNTAMVGAQSQMGRIAADAVNPQTRSQYASYAQLDRYLRPLYTGSGFSLSFDEGEGAAEGFVRVVCYVAHIGGHTRTYHCDIPADGKGAKGGDVMTRTHAVGSGKSYGKRYLLKDIFNVAVGEDDDDGNAASPPGSAPPKPVSEFTQGWIDYALSHKGTAEFAPACKQARAEISKARDIQGLKDFNAAMGVSNA